MLRQLLVSPVRCFAYSAGNSEEPGTVPEACLPEVIGAGPRPGPRSLPVFRVSVTLHHPAWFPEKPGHSSRNPRLSGGPFPPTGPSPPRSLAVVPLIADKRYYGEATARPPGRSGAGLEQQGPRKIAKRASPNHSSNRRESGLAGTLAFPDTPPLPHHFKRKSLQILRLGDHRDDRVVGGLRVGGDAA